MSAVEKRAEPAFSIAGLRDDWPVTTDHAGRTRLHYLALEGDTAGAEEALSEGDDPNAAEIESKRERESGHPNATKKHYAPLCCHA